MNLPPILKLFVYNLKKSVTIKKIIFSIICALFIYFLKDYILSYLYDLEHKSAYNILKGVLVMKLLIIILYTIYEFLYQKATLGKYNDTNLVDTIINIVSKLKSRNSLEKKGYDMSNFFIGKDLYAGGSPEPRGFERIRLASEKETIGFNLEYFMRHFDSSRVYWRKKAGDCLLQAKNKYEKDLANGKSSSACLSDYNKAKENIAWNLKYEFARTSYAEHKVGCKRFPDVYTAQEKENITARDSRNVEEFSAGGTINPNE